MRLARIAESLEESYRCAAVRTRTRAATESRADPPREDYIGQMQPLLWILERGMFPESHDLMTRAVVESGQECRQWNDEWRRIGLPNDLRARPIVFHGCLELAALLAADEGALPGAFCDTAAFHCTSWYPEAEP